jgi:hypothetical protein
MNVVPLTRLKPVITLWSEYAFRNSLQNIVLLENIVLSENIVSSENIVLSENIVDILYNAA